MVARTDVIPGGSYLVRMVGTNASAGLTITNDVPSSDLMDTNRNGVVGASDLLAVINSLLHFGSHATPMDMADPQLYLDTNLDGRISPSDMLQVINYLLRVPAPGATPAAAIAAEDVGVPASDGAASAAAFGLAVSQTTTAEVAPAAAVPTVVPLAADAAYAELAMTTSAEPMWDEPTEAAGPALDDALTTSGEDDEQLLAESSYL